MKLQRRQPFFRIPAAPARVARTSKKTRTR